MHWPFTGEEYSLAPCEELMISRLIAHCKATREKLTNLTWAMDNFQQKYAIPSVHTLEKGSLVSQSAE